MSDNIILSRIAYENPATVERLVSDYFNELDSSLAKLSQGNEGQLTNLQSWAFTRREIRIARVSGTSFFIIKATPHAELDEDSVVSVVITEDRHLQKFMAPWKTNMRIGSLPKENYALFMGDTRIVRSGDKLSPPVFQFSGLLASITADRLLSSFSRDKARVEAVNLWNQSLHGRSSTGSFVADLQNVFKRLLNTCKHPKFHERRVHRFINTYRQFLLPEHKSCFFEHRLRLNGKMVVADFILERETGLPPILIELESPAVRMLRKNGEWTDAANHARNQISKWVKFIEENPDNARSQMTFLNGPKQRMVIMSMGFRHIQEMIDAKYQDTMMWTYDLMLQNAKERWNRLLEAQYRLVGLAWPGPLL